MVKIYDETATTFLNNGIATIQPYKCLVYKEDNGSYYVELESPIKDCDYLQQGNIVRVKTPWGWQGFRLGNPLKSSKRVKVKGKHLFYDSERYVIKSASVNNSLASTALTTLDDACDSSTPFIYTGTDITNKATLTVEKVTLQSGISSVIEMWGGHLVRDNWSIAVKATIGEDRGVTLAYGKNIKEIEAVENWDDVCTKIMPVGKDGLTLDEVFLENEQQHKIPYTKIVEFQQDLEKGEAETDEAFTARLKADLKTQAQAYLASHFEPQVNYTVKAHLNDVTDVGDTIRVKHPKCKIELITSVIKVVYDAILERYTSVEFGNYRPQLKDLISTVTKAATESAEKATAKVNERMTAALALATEKIYSYLKDSHIIYDENQILAVDKLPKEKAQKVMQISLGGIAFSKTGINGPFTSAWTLDGTLDMSAINVINLTADMIDVTDLKAFGATIGGWNIGESRIWSKGSTPFLPYTETKSYINKNTGNLVNSSVNVKLTDYIRVTPKEKYIYTGGGINGSVVASVVWYDMSQNFISAEQSFGENIIFTVPANCYYARFQAYTPASSTEETVLKVKNQSDEEKYTFFTPVTSVSDPVWVSGAESLDSYDSAGFILYGDGRVRMGGNQNEGYIMASDNMLHFYGGEYNTAASLKYSVGLVHDEDVLSFVGWLQNSQYKFYTENKEFLKISPENGVIKTNYNDRTDGNVAEIPIGLQHYHRIGANSVRADFGIGNQNGEPSALMATYEKQYVDEEEYYEITSRLEVFKNKSGASLVNLRVSNSDTDFTPLKFGKNQIWYAGEITVNGVNVNEKINNLLARVEDLESTVDGIEDYLMQLGG